MTAEHDTALRELVAWAESYYPAKATPPPDLRGFHNIPGASLVWIFDNTASARGHLALVDQAPLRNAVERHPPGSPVREAVTRSWKRHNAGGLDPVELGRQ